MNEKQIWTEGRRKSYTCVTAAIYDSMIVATGDADQITFRQMEKALAREFPDHTFIFSTDRDYLRADAKRWKGDGIK